MNEGRTALLGEQREGTERKCTDHDAREQTDSFATVSMRNHVSIANRQESNRDKPHGPQEVTGHILGIMIPKKKQTCLLLEDKVSQ